MASSPPSSDGFSANLSPRTAEPIANQHSATMDHLQQSLSSANSNLERVEHSLNDALINFMTIYRTNPVFYTSQASTVIQPPSLQHLETASMLAQTSRATIKANAPESASTLADAALIVVVGSRTSSMGARPVPAAPRRIRLPRIGIRGVVLATGAFALAVPLAATIALRIFDDQLIQRTEAQLIGQAVLIGEAWREAWLRENESLPDTPTKWIPPQFVGQDYFPFEPILRLDQGVLPPTADPVRFAETKSGPAWRAGASIEPILKRAVRMNLSSARVLSPDGCVVASSSGQHGACLDDLVEVRSALAGSNGAVQPVAGVMITSATRRAFSKWPSTRAWRRWAWT